MASGRGKFLATVDAEELDDLIGGRGFEDEGFGGGDDVGGAALRAVDLRAYLIGGAVDVVAAVVAEEFER